MALMTAREAAAILGVKWRTVIGYRRRGVLTGIAQQKGLRRVWMYDKQDVEALRDRLARRTQEGE